MQMQYKLSKMAQWSYSLHETASSYLQHTETISYLKCDKQKYRQRFAKSGYELANAKIHMKDQPASVLSPRPFSQDQVFAFYFKARPRPSLFAPSQTTHIPGTIKTKTIR
jgi:hypothetical protein